MIDILTDNRNRTAADIRHIFSKSWRKSWRIRLRFLDV